ncbi:MAG: M50 family metallopeptidase [Candidatus Binataceae bacterium]
MSVLTSILAAALVFGILIVVHEAGHFAVAKRAGVRVIRFSIGYPPKIWGIRRGETDYAIGATPFGGYVRMLGDEVGEELRNDELAGYLHEIGLDLIDAASARGIVSGKASFDESLKTIAERINATGGSAQEILGRALTPDEVILTDEIPSAENIDAAIKKLAENPPAALAESFKRRAFPTQPLGRRALIVLAGPFANLIFAPILLTIVFLFGVPQILPVVGKVEKTLPAYAAGIRPGDRISSIDGKPTKLWVDVSDLIKSGGGAPVTVGIDRKQSAAAAHLSLVIKPAKMEQETIYGTKVNTWVIGIMASGAETTEHFGPLGAMREAVTESAGMTVQFCVEMVKIFSGAIPVRQALGGPIMIAQVAGKEVHQGFRDLAMLIAMLSLELGVINLLPVPLLDGGHLLFFAFEAARGKPLKLRARELMLEVGLVLLVALMAFVIYNDIARIVQG